MTKIKDIPKVDRPRERFIKKGPEALSKGDLLAILLGSGIQGKNVQKLSQQIINKFGKNFLDITNLKLGENYYHFCIILFSQNNKIITTFFWSFFKFIFK